MLAIDERLLLQDEAQVGSVMLEELMTDVDLIGIREGRIFV